MLGGGNESFYTFRERGEGMIKEEKGRIIREEVTMFLISQIGVPMATELLLFLAQQNNVHLGKHAQD